MGSGILWDFRLFGWWWLLLFLPLLVFGFFLSLLLLLSPLLFCPTPLDFLLPSCLFLPCLGLSLFLFVPCPFGSFLLLLAVLFAVLLFLLKFLETIKQSTCKRKNGFRVVGKETEYQKEAVFFGGKENQGRNNQYDPENVEIHRDKQA